MADAEIVLRELIDNIVEERQYKDHEIDVKAINSGGANYTSVLFLVTLKFPDGKDVNLFAKVACIGGQMRVAMHATRLFYLEAFFYNQLSKTYQELELKHDVEEEDRLLIPKFYGCKTTLNQETVVLENLVAAGFSSYSRFDSIDWDHAAAAIEALAKFHALSFAFQKENPEEFEVVAEDVKFSMPPRDSSMRAVWDRMVKSSLNVIKEEYRERILKCLEKLGEEAFRKFRSHIKVRVITHGDYRPSNLLFKKQDDKVVAVPLDFQTIHVGCPAADLLYFQCLGTDSKFRAAHHDRLLDHYHQELSAALQRLGVDVTEVYPREVFDEEYKEMLPFMLFLGMSILPIVLVEAAKAPRVDGDDAFDSFVVPNNDIFAERFADIVDDCVRWGVI